MSHHPTNASAEPKRNLTPLWVLLGLLVAAIVAAAIIIPQLFTNAVNEAEATTNPTGSDGHSQQATPDYMVIGQSDAKVEVKVYSDYLCPHCAVFQQDVETKLEPLITDGTVKLVIQDLIVVDPNASTKLAVAARAAGEQGKYHEFYVAAMDYQEKIHTKGALEDSDLLAIAETAGVPDLDQFIADTSSSALRTGVQQSIDEAVAAGVDSTPTVLVNGTKLDVPTYEAVMDAIEKAK